MKDIMLRVMRRLLAESDGRGEIHVYDFDDTLVKTDSHVHVVHDDGSRRALSPHEYAVYTPMKGDTFDYSDFEQVKDPDPILSMVNKMKQSIMTLGRDNVFVLTARGNSGPVKEYLSTLGFGGIEVYAVGTSNPEAKAGVIRDHILSRALTRVVFYDDSPKYIDSVGGLRDEFPGVEIVTIQV